MLEKLRIFILRKRIARIEKLLRHSKAIVSVSRKRYEEIAEEVKAIYRKRERYLIIRDYNKELEKEIDQLEKLRKKILNVSVDRILIDDNLRFRHRKIKNALPNLEGIITVKKEEKEQLQIILHKLRK